MNLLAEDSIQTDIESDFPIIVIGTGPVGIEFVRTAMQLMPTTHFMLFGNERWEPYNRVKLSSLFAGHLHWDEMMTSQKLPTSPLLDIINNCGIVEINRQRKTVADATGYTHRYKALVIATGSRPFVPSIPGITLKNIFTFREMSDIEQLLARRIMSRKTIVVGGGVLGIEAARAMMRENTKVGIVDHLPNVMSNQLDEQGAELLQSNLLADGIELYLGNGIRAFCGEDKLEKIILKNGSEIECDTVILATGIRPNINLAVRARLSTNRGVRVNDAMQTSDEYIYAIGECAEHRGEIYGLVRPGYEQARVAANNLAGKESNYTGSIAATQLKVVGVPAFSVGNISEVSIKGLERELIYRNDKKNIYRRLVVKNRKIVGAIAVGKWDEQGRVHESLNNGRNIWFWSRRRFLKTGYLWSEENSSDVNQWPSTAVVCNCNGITRGELSVAINKGLTTIAEISQCTGASTVCGGCKPLVSKMLMSDVKPEVIGYWQILMSMGVVSILAMLLMMFLPSIPYATSADIAWQWDILWRDNLYKQISGFSLLGLFVVVLLMSLRKRVKNFSIFPFSIWRLIHVVVGVLTIAGLVVHSGYSLGNGLNFMLASSVVALLLMGGISSAMMAVQHKLDAVSSRKIKDKLVWLHIVSFWPVPVLLTAHIIKSYYF